MLMREKASKTLLLTFFICLTLATANGQEERSRTSAPAASEVTITVNEQFFNSFLDVMFANLKAPSTPLVIMPSDKDRSPAESYGCPSVITLQREEDGVRTAIKLGPGRITAPLAFAGSYNSTLLGCLEFRGWANTTWNLEFDRSRQALLARVQIDEIHLTNVPKLAAGSLTKIVQSEIDKRINPLELFRIDQLSARLPVAPAKGALRLRARDLTPEIAPGLLLLHVTYEFAPDPGQPSPVK